MKNYTYSWIILSCIFYCASATAQINFADEAILINPEFLPDRIAAMQESTSPMRSVEDSVVIDALVDSVVIQREGSTAWYKYQVRENEFDNGNNITTETIINTNEDASFSSANRSEMVYVQDGFVSQKDRQQGVSFNSWQQQFREIFTYNPNMDNTETILKLWQSNVNEWADYQQTLRTFNGQNQMIEKVTNNWNGNQASWTPLNKEQVVYDGNLQTSTIYNYDFGTQDYALYQKIDNTFDGNGNSTGNSIYFWDANNNDWELSSESTIEYTADQKVTKYEYYLYIANQLVLGNKYDYTYTEGLHTQTVISDWDVASAGFVENSRRLINRDIYGNVLYVQAQDKDLNTSQWESTSQTWDYYYTYIYGEEDTTVIINPIDTTTNPIDTTTNPIDTTTNPIDTTDVGLGDYLEVQKLAKVSPNPSTGLYNVQLSNELIAIEKRIMVYDMNGQMVYSAKMDGTQLNVNLDNLRSGTYFMSIQTSKGIINKKIILQ